MLANSFAQTPTHPHFDAYHNRDDGETKCDEMEPGITRRLDHFLRNRSWSWSWFCFLGEKIFAGLFYYPLEFLCGEHLPIKLIAAPQPIR